MSLVFVQRCLVIAHHVEVRLALEQGRPSVAAWLVENLGGSRVYVQSEAYHRTVIFEDAARRAVARGDMSAREAGRVYGVDRQRLGA